ncbi:NAD-dependent epimerase/dehydratase family protein [Candidatus Omnitrophota bacterium]
MKILITGATGFIGKALLKRLIPEGHEIVCTVRKTSDTDFLERAGVRMVTVDLLNAEEIERVFGEEKPDAVFHCAASVTEPDEDKLHEVNVKSTRNVYQASYKNNVDRLVYISSVAVVSGNEDVPLTDDLPLKASNPYGRSKIEAEKIALEFREKGLKTAILRPCMIYGEDEPHALDRILEAAAKRHIPILDVKGMDSQLHLAYIGNVAEALELALFKEEALSGTFMIADKDVITLRKFLEIVYDELGVGYPRVIPAWLVNFLSILPPVKRKISRIFKDRVYDISRARDELGYVPGISTEEGLRQTVRYWKSKKPSDRKSKKECFDPTRI